MADSSPAFSRWARPWALMGAGLALCFAALLLSRGTKVPGEPILLLLFPGTLLTGLAVVRQLRGETWAWPGRSESACLVSLAGLGGLLGAAAMRPGWVSGNMFYGFVFILGLAGSLLVLATPLLRRVALSLFVLFHFTGMAVCVTSIDPPNSTGLFASKQLWTWIYRPYLSFLYMTNAYHFYSPDPGHPELLWMAVCYDDGSYTWVKLPERSNSPIGMHYQRMLALPAHSYGSTNRLPLNAAELKAIDPDKRPKRDPWELIKLRRQVGSTYHYRRSEPGNSLPIPMVGDLDDGSQYREPHEMSKMALSSVARRVYLTAPPPRDQDGNVKPGVKVKSVKLYRVVQLILTPLELAQGTSPLDKTKHMPYFMGEFDGNGDLVDDKDPFLYWYLPIAIVPETYPRLGPVTPTINVRATAKEGLLLDCLELHAAGRRRNSTEDKN